MFTSLHRALGIGPTDGFTNDMLDQLVAQRTPESADLDFKEKIDPNPTAAHSDVKKDLAAMANHGGGVIVYGIGELSDQKDHAGKRTDAGEINSGFEHAYMSAAISQVVPPIFGVQLYALEDEIGSALVVVVPHSRQSPHMFFAQKKNSPRTLSVPVRHGSHTEWLSESEIARLYRQRFAQQEETEKALSEQYQQVMDLRDNTGYWMAGVARPVSPTVVAKPSQNDITKIALSSYADILRRDYTGAITALSATHRPVRPGFRSWRFTRVDKKNGTPESYVEFHNDGAISILCRLDTENPQTHERQVYTSRPAAVVGDLLACLRHYRAWTGAPEYDVLLNAEWSEAKPLVLEQSASPEFYKEPAMPIRQFAPIKTTVDVTGDDAQFLETARALALDCMNQAGLSQLPIFNNQ